MAKISIKAGSKPPTKTALKNDVDKENRALKCVVWKSHDDGVLVGVLTEHPSADNQSSNGWKSIVWMAASLALEESEMKSGGAPKMDDACLTHWGKVLIIYFHSFV